jgi:hypothetical protein
MDESKQGKHPHKKSIGLTLWIIPKIMYLLTEGRGQGEGGLFVRERAPNYHYLALSAYVNGSSS